MGRLEGKTALITGSARGIGFAMAKLFTREGALVAICDLNIEACRKSAAELDQFGRAGIPFEMDVSKRESVEKAVEEFIEKQGKLDILVNNAGITGDSLLMRMSDKQWEDVLRINLYGTFYCTQAAIRSMIKARSGRIINIASVVGVMGNAGQANYAASKGGIIAFTKSVAREVASRSITANAIAPGFIKTALTEQMTEKARSAIVERIPMVRLGEVEDIAKVALFLASDDAGYMTGQVLVVDGGLVM